MLTRNRTTAILLHDGAVWHAVVLARSGGAWVVRAAESLAGRNGGRLPEEWLNAAVRHRCGRLAVLLPGHLHLVRFLSPPDIEPEELQTALRFEAASELGPDAPGLRLAAAAADAFDLGFEPGTWLLAGFPDALPRTFALAAADHGLRFIGTGSLEQAALAWLHARRSGDARLLLLKETTAFYAAPALGDIPLVVATLPVGTRPDTDPERDRERLERSARRLATHAGMPLTVLSCPPVTEAGQARLAELFTAPEAVEWHALTDVLGEVALRACSPGHGAGEGTCPLVGPSPPPGDPHRAGTWLFFIILLATLVGVGLKIHTLGDEQEALRARKQRWIEVEAARKAARERVATLRSQRDAEIAKRKALTETQILPAGFLPTLDALTKAMPPYTRIERLAENDIGAGLELRGSTRWQQGLTELVHTLNNALRPHGLIVLQDTIELAEGAQREQTFTYRIVPMEVKP